MGILAAIAVAVFLILALVLVPSHRQVRAVDPPLPNVEAMLAAAAVPAGPTRVRYVNSSSQPNEDRGMMGHPSFVLDWADGKRFMIDAGMEPEVAIEFGKPMEWVFGAEPAVAHGAIAEQMGDGVGMVGGIAFTHLHHDHTQGIVALCRRIGRALPIFQNPFQFERRNHTTDMGFAFIEEARALPGAPGCAEPTRLEDGPVESVHPIPGFPGLVAIPVGGHTPGSTLYLAKIFDRYWLFSGDITNTRRDLVEDLPKPAFYSLLIVPEATERLARLRPWLGALDRDPRVTVVVSHDLTALQKTSIEAWPGGRTDP